MIMPAEAEPVEARGDFLNQLLFAGDAARRLIAMQDRDPNSPSFGSFHCAYWRDKTSEFSDARFQEAGATLGLLAHPHFAALGAARGWPSGAEMTEASYAGLLHLQRIQYPEGCYDEWYKGERGYAATAFTTFAYASMANFLGPLLPEKLRDILLPTLSSAAGWLTRHEDLVKTNHEVVAAAALAAFSRTSGDAKWLGSATEKMRTCISVQSDEGWFPELRGMDFGYSALVLDYLMFYHRASGDPAVLKPASALLEFMLAHLHPDITLSAEGGTCRNSYAGQCGYLLLAPHNAAAGAIAEQLAGMNSSRLRISSYLGDDLRLARWSLLPVMGALISTAGPKTSSEQRDIPYPQGWTLHRKASVAAYHRGGLHVYVPFAGGGVTRIYSGSELCVSDFGIDVTSSSGTFTALSYSAERPAALTDATFSVSFELAKPKYFFPSFLQRLLLRSGSLTAVTSRFTRAAIDVYRQRAKTAINQASTSVGHGRSGLFLSREIAIGDGHVAITDILKGAAGAEAILRYRAKDHHVARPATPVATGELTVSKTYDTSSHKLVEKIW